MTDLEYDTIIEQISACLNESGMYDMIDKNMIKKGITNKCKANMFSERTEAKATEKAEKEAQKAKEKADKAAAKAEKEAKRLRIKEENERIKAEKKKAIQDIKADMPNMIYNYLKEKHPNMFSYNISKNKVYYNDELMTADIKSRITFEVNIWFEEKGVACANKLIESVIADIAKEKKFKENVIVDKSADIDFDIIKDCNEDNWEENLQKDDKDNIKHTIFNYMLFLSFHPQFNDKIKMNAFDKIEYLVRYDKSFNDITNKPIDDYEADLMKSYIEKYFGACINTTFNIALNNVLLRNSFHPIKEYFNMLKQNKDTNEFANQYGWDGTPRVRTMLVKYFDCPDIAPIHEMTEVMMCGAYQRIYEERPDAGVPFDFMGIIFGTQGTGKTKFFTRLFGDKYTIINPRVDDDQSFVDLTNRAWLVLFDEMKAIDKADMPTVKSRITEQGCTTRLSYGRRSRYYPRHCVYWGNTNEAFVLRDDGYERRFLCFESNAGKRPAEWWKENYTDYIINQIWAETATIYYEKYVGKVIEISPETQLYNQMVQVRHKIWNDDTRTKLELSSIFTQDYEKMVYFDTDFRQFLRETDLNHTKNGDFYVKNDEKLPGFKLKIVKKEWILSRFNRKNAWIDGLVKSFGWSEIEVDDEFLGKGTYYLAPNCSYEDIRKEYEESHDTSNFNNMNGLDYNDTLFFGYTG